MTTGVFIAVYAVVATAVGLAYFARQQWHDFFDRHAIRGDAREALTLHLLIGAAAVGAAWPVAIVFAALWRLRDTRPARGRAAGRTGREACGDLGSRRRQGSAAPCTVLSASEPCQTCFTTVTTGIFPEISKKQPATK